MTCGECGQPSAIPHFLCVRCEQTISGPPANSERDCLSIQAYRKGDCRPAFAPDEVLYALKKEASGPVEVGGETELRRRLASGELDSSVLIRGFNQPDFIKADECSAFRDVARPRPAPEPVDPFWEYKALVGAVAQTAKQSELVQWFLDGSLDAETLVRKKGLVRFVMAGRSHVFGSIARPRLVSPSTTPAPVPVPPGGIPPVWPSPAPAPPPLLAPPPLPAAPPGPSPPPTGSRWLPAIIGVGAYFATALIGVGMDRVAFLGSQVDNMAVTSVSAAFIAFVLYCLAHGALGNTRIFRRALVIGGLLWLIFGPPQVSSLVDPKGGSRVLIHVFPLSWYAQLPKNDRNGLEVLSVFVMPLVAGLLGRALASFGARNPRLTKRLLLPIYVIFIVLGLVGVLALRFTSIPEHGAATQAAKKERGVPASDAATPSQPKATTINLVSSDSNATFLLSGPERLSATGSTVFADVPCGSYKVVASLGGLDFASKIEATPDTNYLVEYRWENLKIRVESPEALTICLDERVLGTNSARVRAPVGRCAVVLRGEGKTKARVYTPGTDMKQWTEETWKCNWHAEAPLDLPEGQQIAHQSGVLRGFVYGAGDMGESTYDLYFEKEPAPLSLVIQQGDRKKDTLVAAPLAVSAPMITTQQDVEDPKIANTGTLAAARVGGGRRASGKEPAPLPLVIQQGEREKDTVVAAPLAVSAPMIATRRDVEDPKIADAGSVPATRLGDGRRASQVRTNSLGQIFVPVAGTRVFFSVWDTRVKDYAAYAAANKVRSDSWRKPVYDGVPVTPEETCPVVNVSWEEAVAYCAWLTAKEQKDGQIGPDAKYRLPTDAEWTIAAGLVEADNERPKYKDSQVAGVYPWGTEWPPPAGAGNYADTAAKRRFPKWKGVPGYDDGYATTSPVGRFSPNQNGLFDMGGNVWQWCGDYYDSRQDSRVLRGGAWVCDSALGVLSSARLNRRPSSREVFSGFRVVLATETSSE